MLRFTAAAFLVIASLTASAQHLAGETSRYLREHADNPVAWRAWNDQSLAEAKKLGRPIFLSVGYASCHWCHVMERESFRSPQIAAILNERFVPILVDREEHADVDATYVAWMQAMTGDAGWPMNLILTPDLQPVFGATYMKREVLQKTLVAIADRWRDDRGNLLAQSDQLASMTRAMAAENSGESGPVSPAMLEAAAAELAKTYDAEHGGFGTAPKFPQPLAIQFLLRQNRDDARSIALRTLEKLAASALHDQVGGGFHRYAADAAWREPHFEKMLTDQALLAIAYVEAWQITKDARFRAVAESTLDYALRELREPDGAFASAQDADTGDTEGAFYTWTAEEIGAALPESLAKRVVAHLDPRTYVLFDLQDATARKLLATARARRQAPARDDKVVTGWNALMISALARAGAAFGEPRYVEAARTAARFLESHSWSLKTRRLSRTWNRGRAGVDALSDDYALLVQALLDLYESAYDVHDLDLALVLQKRQDEIFWRESEGRYANGGLLSSPLGSIASENELALPAANSVALTNLLRLAELTDSDPWRARAARIAASFAPRMRSDPAAMPAMLSGAWQALATPKQIVIAGDPAAPATREMLAAVHQTFIPSRVLILAPGGEVQKRLARHLPIVGEMHAIRGRPTAYVCEAYVCRMPATTVEELRERLR